MGVRIYVIAGSAEEARDWARQTGKSPADYVYVTGAHVLRGISRGFRYVRVGNYQTRTDIDELQDVIRARQGVPA